jgi:transposase-like protein
MTLTMANMSSGTPDDRSGQGGNSLIARPGNPTRRSFSAAYKLRIVTEYDSLTEHGARGALLRREGLYQSHVEKWRRARDRGALSRTGAGTSRTASAEVKENRRLREENARLTAELAKTKAVADVLGKNVRALGGSLRERGAADEADRLVHESLTELEAVVSTKEACRLLGLARASVYRTRAKAPHPTAAHGHDTIGRQSPHPG